LDKQTVEKVGEVLKNKPKVVITTHKNPDGDAIGSSLGLYNYLKLKGIDATVITPNDSPLFLSWMPGFETIINYEKDVKQAEAKVKEAGMIFSLDYNALSRIESLGEKLKESSAVKVLIDHHQQPEDFAAFTFSDTTASSTCEMIYRFIEFLGDANIVNADIAECIYTGIMTDTGSFRFPSTTASTHEVVSALIKAGANNGKIHEKIYDTHTFARTKFLGYCLFEKLTEIPHLHTAYIALSAEELAKFSNKKGDTEGIVNYPLSIEGMKVAALFTEKDNQVKISFRSKGNFSVNDFARKHFNGGGHFNAAGGHSTASLKETVDKFLTVLNEYESELATV
jgi:phosphoesterase RecJ-like protein